MFETLFSKGGLSLERLRTLCEIDRAQGIARAARGSTSKLSQYSKQIKELELYFGVPIFNRQKKNLTNAGKRIIEVCKPFLTSLEKLSTDLSGADQAISIGAGQAVLDWVLFPRFTTLNTDFPGVIWSIKGADSRTIAARLLDFDLDFGILRREACQEEDTLQCHPLGTMTFALFVPIALLENRIIPVAALADSEQFTPAFEKVAKTFTPRLTIKIQCQSFSSIKALVKTGQFAGMLPLLAEAEMPESEFHVFKNAAFKQLERKYVLAANRKNLSMRALDGMPEKLKLICSMMH